MLLAKMDSWRKLGHFASAMQLSLLANKEANEKHANNSVLFDFLTLEYPHQLINEDIFNTLIELAKQCDLAKKIDALMTGHPVNNTENRAALHTALRVFNKEPIWVNDRDIVEDVLAVRETMRIISEQIRNAQWLGFSGKPITDIINLGIGGSHLGPLFSLTALADWVTPALKFHFISNMDPNEFKRVTSALNPETTLFIVASKSFTTQETLYNAQKARAWIGQNNCQDNHFIAVTAEVKKAEAYGLRYILPIWDWVGGRYSSCSAINLISCIAIGFEPFLEMLMGANAMDLHFQHSDFKTNLPVLLALFGIWNNNFLQIHNLLLLTYSHDLRYLAPYVQQLDMESNGKSIDKQGRAINYATGPIIWGGAGNQAQHSYYQLLCQGTPKVAVDLISVDSFGSHPINDLCFAHKTILSEGLNPENNPNGYIPGHIPLNHLRLTEYTPRAIGALIALYEHKVYTQGVIWNINSFDQPSVDSSKKICSERQLAYANNAG